jgi:peptidoglycan hydrolase-like protein with peptidoglycan-binding domain
MLRQSLLAGAVLLALTGAGRADYAAGQVDYDAGRYDDAYRALQPAADQGDARAQYLLGRLYAEGRGVGLDFSQAYMWFDLAAANGYPPAVTAREALASRARPDQLSRARSMAEDWRASHGVTTAAAQPAPSAPPPAAAAVPYSVASLQQALADLGYDVGGVDGAVGPRTRAAIRAYQTDAGLPASGEPSLALYGHLQQSLAQGSAAASQAPAPQQPPSYPAGLVSDTQAELRQRGYAISAVTGQLDDATAAAIRQYQADARLAVTGEPSDALLARLREATDRSGADYRTQVKAIQAALNARGYDAGPEDGALGPRTRDAIRTWQADAGLPVTGEASGRLLASLEAPQQSGSSAPEAGAAAAGAEIERRLGDLGYRVGPADGSIDEQTRRAIRAYQADAGLRVTGQPDPELLDDLRRYAGGPRTAGQLPPQRIAELQKLLRRHGYPIGRPDGELDARTVEAIRRYQADAGLPVTGAASPGLLLTLRDDRAQ